MLFKDSTCSREHLSLKITPQMTIERSGYTPTGWPVQIQENDSVKLEMWLATDEERQQLVTALLAGTKV